MAFCPIAFQALYYEQWKLISDISVPNISKNMYYISNFGRVYSLYTNRFLTLTKTNNGYFRVMLRRNDGSCRYHLIHRIVMIEFHYISNYSEMQVNHIDGDKSYNYDDNLEWCTCKENIIHAYNSGLKVCPKGEECSFSTISNLQAENIAKLLSEKKYSQQEIADIVGCNKNIVSNISTGANWKDIYNKYSLSQYKRCFNLNLSDEQLHLLCKYFQDHKNDYYKNNNHRFNEALKILFDIDYDIYTMSATMSRIYNHKTRKDITDNYNY